MIADYFVGNSLWYLIKQSDPMSTLILLILFAISMLCWTVFLSKVLVFFLRRRAIKRAYRQLQAVRSIDDLIRLENQLVGTVSGQLLAQCLLTIDTVFGRASSPAYSGLSGRQTVEDKGRRIKNWDLVHYHIDQAVDILVAHEESYLSTLSTSAAVSPLLGLFGTVWGLIHAFIRISERQSADITVVAPGIAEALITTLAGLMVAIPALVMYNYLVVRVRQIEYQVVQFADQVSLIIHQAFTE